jgi:hypothetical protein
MNRDPARDVDGTALCVHEPDTELTHGGWFSANTARLHWLHVCSLVAMDGPDDSTRVDRPCQAVRTNLVRRLGARSIDSTPRHVSHVETRP